MYNWFRFSTGKNMLMKMLQFLAIFLIPMLLNLFSCITCAQDAMMPNQTIRDGQTLVSSGRTFELGFFSPIGSNSRYLGIWYRNITDHTVVWTANRESPLASSTGTLALTAEGNLIICNHSGDIIWSTRTSSTSIPIVQLLDSGNLVLIGGKSLLWQSFDHLTNTLVPGMKLGIDLKSNLSRQLSSWRSTADPSQGPFTYKVDPHGSGELCLWNGSVPMFRTGPWNGQAASGFPLIRWSNLFTVTFTSNQDEIYYEYEAVNKSIQWRVLLTPNGIVQRWVLMDPSDGWSLYFSLPMDQCDEYAQCGPYGVCNTNDWPVCKCLWGFEPKSGEEWALRDGTHGCVRRTKLGCESGDGFLKMSRVKLPDTTNATMDGGASLDECKERCQRNCACKAFAAITLEGTGCFIWFGDLMDIKEFTEGGQDLYVRLAASELDQTSDGSNKRKHILVICITTVPGTSLLIWICSYIWKGKRKQDIIDDSHSSESRGKEFELPLFDMSSIEKATDNFSTENKLGEGGFGTVYKGWLGDEQEIAVKRLSKHSVQGLDEFRNEVMLIAKLQHRNLVRLLGCCIHCEERMLIYEYMPNKSLDSFIFDKTKGALLDWHKRISIISGIARGLLYLHQDSRLKIVHRDLKTSNILLDEEMNPKISDFGIARIFKGDQAHESTKRVIGTYGYMSPEYVMDGIFSVKSDVFSFGVIILEILSGKKNRVLNEAESHINLLGHAWRLWNEGKCLELLDSTVNHSIPVTEILRCMQVGLLCVQGRREDRPTMQSVVLMLGSDGTVLPQPKRPGFCMAKSDFSSTGQDLCASNGITITIIEGR